MKCVLTNEETNSLTKGKPLSRKGRELVKDYLLRFEESGMKKEGFILTQRTAMDDLYQGRDIIREYKEVKEKIAIEKAEKANDYMLDEKELEGLDK